MSLYNLLHGVTISTFVILPMLGKHTDPDVPFTAAGTSVEDLVLEKE